MTMPPTDLQRFRTELRGAIEKDLARRAVRRQTARRAARLGVPGTLALALGVSLVLALGGGPGVRLADAAVLTAAESALTPPPGTIVHERAIVTVGDQPPQPYEVWIEANAPRAYRVIKFGTETAWDGKTMSLYNQASNTITTAASTEGSGSSLDITAILRSLISSGKTQVTGTTMVDGVPARTLAISGLPSGWVSGAANGTYDVARSDSHPLLIQATGDCGSSQCLETVRFQAYEYLPATPANLALLNLQAQHPGATSRPAPSETAPSGSAIRKSGR